MEATELSRGSQDGAAGLLAIERAGGIAIVQDPSDALFPSMPAAALEAVPKALSVRAEDMAHILVQLVRDAPAADAPRPPRAPIAFEDRTADLELQGSRAAQNAGPPSEFVCPDCGGTLFELSEGALRRFRCRVGHAYSFDSLCSAVGEKLEEALWSAMRALQEHADLSRRGAARARSHGLEAAAEAYERTARDDERRAEIVRAALAAADKARAR